MSTSFAQRPTSFAQRRTAHLYTHTSTCMLNYARHTSRIIYIYAHARTHARRRTQGVRPDPSQLCQGSVASGVSSVRGAGYGVRARGPRGTCAPLPGTPLPGTYTFAPLPGTRAMTDPHACQGRRCHGRDPRARRRRDPSDPSRLTPVGHRPTRVPGNGAPGRRGRPDPSQSCQGSRVCLRCMLRRLSLGAI